MRFKQVFTAVALVLSLGAGVWADVTTEGQVRGKDQYAPGCYVAQFPGELKVKMNDKVRVERNKVVIAEGRITNVQVQQVSFKPADAKADIEPGDVIFYLGPP